MSDPCDRYLEAAAPRYTSYPPAPQFHAGVDGPLIRGWLSELDPDASLSLYLHIPYCRSMCWYCGCHTVASTRDGPVIEYAFRLLREIKTVAAASAAKKVKHIHWGGGTPNALPPATFALLMAGLNEAFDLSGLVEHAIEIDCRTLTPEHVSAFAQAGITRASLGVQDLNLEVQQAIGRVQPFAEVELAVSRLRAAGVAAVNLDLMYGLPRQTVQHAARTAEQALTLNPDRLAVFGYAHVPWFKSRQRLIEAEALPGARERLQQAAAMRGVMLAHGYSEIGFDHYARPGDALAAAAAAGALRRNFQGYVADAAEVLIGLGASAISTFPQGYAQNAADIPAWTKAVEQGELATVRGIAVSEDDRRRRAVIERILCDFALDLTEFGGWAAFADALEVIQDIAADGLVQIDGERLLIPDPARPFVRLVAQAFDAYAKTRETRHSRAI